VSQPSDRVCSQLVAGAGDSSGTQRKGNVRRWKSLQSSAVETVTENTSLCVIVICTHELCVKLSNKSDYQSKPFYNHTLSRGSMVTKCGTVGGIRISRGLQSTFLNVILSTQIQNDLTSSRTQAAAVGSRQLTARGFLRSLLHYGLEYWCSNLKCRKRKLWSMY
jgi:hypothetical protein